MSTETPLDLKKTVNLPKTAFSQKANLAQSEPARLEKWSKLDLYRLIRRASDGRSLFFTMVRRTPTPTFISARP